MMPLGLKNDTIENTSSNTTTNSMNTEEKEKTKSLTFSLRKENVEEKNEEKEGIFRQFMNKLENISEQFMNKFINFIKTKEPGWWTYHLPDKHTDYTDKMLIIGVGMSIFGLWSGVGALFAHMAGSPIVTEVLGFTALLSVVVGFSLAATALLIDGIADLRE